MAETPVPITTGNGSASIAGDLVSGNTYQQIKVVDGTIGGSTPLKVNADGSITASIYGNITVAPPANQSVSGTVGASVFGTVVIGSPTTVVDVGTSYPSTDGNSVPNNLKVATFPLVYNSANGTWDRWYGNSSVGAIVSTGKSSVIAVIQNNPLVTNYAPSASLISGVTSVITGTSSVQVLAPAAGGQRNYITNVLVTNAAAVGTTVQLFDAGNVIYAGYAAASGGGFALSFPAPLKQSSIAGNLSALSTVQASIFVSASGYTAA